MNVTDSQAASVGDSNSAQRPERKRRVPASSSTTGTTIQSPERKRRVWASPFAVSTTTQKPERKRRVAMPRIPPSPFRIHHSAFTLAESLVSMVLVAGVVVAALSTVGASKAGQYRTADRSVGHLLAHDLMAEILTKEYEEPDDTPLFGPEALENVGTRANYDDVDDYSSWTSAAPVDKDGMAMSGFDGWERHVDVEWVDPEDLTTPVGSVTNVKRITVRVEHNDIVMAELVALRTQGLPPPNSAPIILFVSCNPTLPTAQETARITLIQSWGYEVTLIGVTAPQSEFDEAVATANVAYVSEEVLGIDLGTKLRAAPIGVVNEDPELIVEFGFASDRSDVNEATILIDNNTHYITSGFEVGTYLALCSSSQPIFALRGFGPPVLPVLAYTRTSPPLLYPSLAYFEVGNELYGGGIAAARRVQLPWGGDEFDIGALTPDGLTIMKRAIEWAGNMEVPPGP